MTRSWRSEFVLRVPGGVASPGVTGVSQSRAAPQKPEQDSF